MGEPELSFFYEQNRDRFVGWARKQFGLEEEDAVDVYQDTIIAFMRTTGGKGSVQLTCDPTTYLFSIGRNLALKHLRDRGRATSLSVVGGPGPEPMELPQVEHDADREHTLHIVSNGFDGLSERQREILQLYYYEGFSMKEIATKMGYAKAEVAKKMKCEAFRKLSALVKKSATKSQLLHVE